MRTDSVTTQHGLCYASAEGRSVGVYVVGATEDEARERACSLVHYLQTMGRDELVGFFDCKVSARSAVVNGRERRAAWRIGGVR